VTIEFRDALGEGARSSLAPGRYRHFKGGEYEVLGIARDSESMRELVVDVPSLTLPRRPGEGTRLI
jgi:hypothetical protein